MLRKKRSSAGKIVRNILLILLLLLVIAYAAGAFYFHDHYFLNTVINDSDCGLLTPEELISRNERNADDYLLTIMDRESNKYQVKGMDISCAYQTTGEEAAILDSQNEFLWPLCLLSDYYYITSGEITYSEEELDQVLSQMELFDEDYAAEPENASVILTSDGYEIVPETLGNKFDQQTVAAEIKEAISQQKTYYGIPDELYQAPEITSEDPKITELTAQLDSYFNAQISYQIGDQTENVDQSRIATFLTINEDYTVSINEKQVVNYVDYLASKYNTYGDERKFKTNKGDTITIGGGDYGWVISKSEEEAQIIADLEGGQPVEREPMWEQTAAEYGTDDIGTTYIEIDYSAQHMWYYVDGVVKLESDIVSGNVNKQNGSVDGVYKIAYKKKDATLVGEDYSSKVSYFMPFAYNIGFHDASWRDKFGGSIYKTDGSHGCINMPVDKAKQLYDLVEVGTPVIAYYRENVTLTNNAAKESNAYSYQAAAAKTAE